MIKNNIHTFFIITFIIIIQRNCSLTIINGQSSICSSSINPKIIISELGTISGSQSALLRIAAAGAAAQLPYYTRA